MPQMAKDVFMARFIAAARVAVKPHVCPKSGQGRLANAV
jgi:hypothetical protein